MGSNLVEALKKEHTIYGLDIINPAKDGIEKTFSWEELEKSVSGFKIQDSGANESEKIPEVDAIIHLAGKAHDTKNKSAADVYFKVNTGLTQKMFDYFLAHDSIKKFIQFSTVKSAADRVEGEFLTEECVPTPVGPYGESKIAAENYIIEKFAPEALKRPFHNFTDEDAVAFAEVQEPNGSKGSKSSSGSRIKVQGEKKVYIMRPCMIHGPGNKATSTCSTAW